MLSLRTLEVALQQHARPGRNGITALRAAIDAWAIDTRPADSLLERAMRALVTRYSLPPVEFHKVIEGWEVDFWVVGTPIVLECDGWATHGLEQSSSSATAGATPNSSPPDGSSCASRIEL